MIVKWLHRVVCDVASGLIEKATTAVCGFNNHNTITLRTTRNNGDLCMVECVEWSMKLCVPPTTTTTTTTTDDLQSIYALFGCPLGTLDRRAEREYYRDQSSHCPVDQAKSVRDRWPCRLEAISAQTYWNIYSTRIYCSPVVVVVRVRLCMWLSH